jgi:hypothetical protein
MELIVPQLFGCDYAVFLSQAVVLPLDIRFHAAAGWLVWMEWNVSEAVPYCRQSLVARVEKRSDS